MRRLIALAALTLALVGILLQPVADVSAQNPLLFEDVTAFYDRARSVLPGSQIVWPFDETSGTTARAVTGLTPNVVANGAFDTDVSWTKGTGWTIDTGDSNVATHAGGAGDLSQAVLATGITYSLTYTVTGRTAGTIIAKLGSGTSLTTRSTNATFTESGVCAGSTSLIFTADADFDGSIDNVICTGPSGYAVPFNATYSGVTLATAGGPDGRPVPSYDGLNDFTNLYTTALANAFNGAEGTIIVPVKVSAAGVWTDGTARVIANIRADIQNIAVYIYRPSANNNQITVLYRAGNTSESVNVDGLSTTGWMYWALVWTKSGDRFEVYLDGVSQGSSATLGVWAGVGLAAANATIGADGTSGVLPWSGFIGPLVLYDVALTQPQVRYICTVQTAELADPLEWLSPRKYLAKVLQFPAKKQAEKPQAWRKAA